MSNFEFLRGKTEYEMFALAAIEAERVFATSTTMCAIGSRKALELAVKWVYSADNTMTLPFAPPGKEPNLQALLHNPSFKFAFDYKTWSKLPFIVKLGNMAVHTGKSVRAEDALLSLRNLFNFIDTIDYLYGADYEERHFDESIIPKEKVVVDEKKIKEQESLILVQGEKLRELEEKIAKMADELTRAKEKNKSERRFAGDDISEFETRKRYIDLDLELGGWELFGERQNVSVEFKVDDYEGVLGQDGFVDYVLWGADGKPLALVEAKRTSVDPNAGRQQAKLYADSLERRFKRRPFIFYTNGFETYFWDDSDGGFPPRLVSAVFSREDLERLTNRRSLRRDPSSEKVNEAIASRPYQLAAIAAVCDNLRLRFRKNLLVMATGTGKTRTAAALVDVLMRSGNVTNVLFLADRISLVKQAHDAFKEYLPNLSLCNLCESKQNILARAVFSTYPTILNAIDEAKDKDGKRLFSPAHFDLIIVDEAHRSIFNKYRAIFDYFDAILTGLTATPKKEIDRDTYEFFEMKEDIPTFVYDYDDAVSQGYLVPYKSFAVTTKFLEKGIVYKDLSEEEQREYEATFTEDGVMPEEILPEKLNKFVFNKNTIDIVIEDLMTRGIRVNGGDKLGKTIIFAANKSHAQLIVERFDALYPHYAGKFARRIVCDDVGAQSLIDDFKGAEKNPFIAVSVDMLDTGIDVPECVNLVFFKRVRSQVKFWQMIGRGTRLCRNLNAVDCLNGEQIEYEDKKYFLIFDYGGNFEYFSQHPKEISSAAPQSLSEKIFIKQVRILSTLQSGDYETDEYLAYRASLADFCHARVAEMSAEFVEVRLKREFAERFKVRARFDNLSLADVRELTKELAPLVKLPYEDEFAKRFDNFMYSLMLQELADGKTSAKARESLENTARKLKGVAESIPQVKKRLAELDKVLSEDYWTSGDVLRFDDTREALRDLIQFIYDKSTKHEVYSDLPDVVEYKGESEPIEPPAKFDDYRKLVNRYIVEHGDNELIRKLTKNEPLTQDDVFELSEIFLSELGNAEDYKRTFKEVPLGILVRRIAGMDKEAVNAAFADFINRERLNFEQITFIEKVITHIVNNGYVENTKSFWQNEPFKSPKTMPNLFEAPQILSLMSIIDSFAQNAAV